MNTLVIIYLLGGTFTYTCCREVMDELLAMVIALVWPVVPMWILFQAVADSIENKIERYKRKRHERSTTKSTKRETRRS